MQALEERSLDVLKARGGAITKQQMEEMYMKRICLMMAVMLCLSFVCYANAEGAADVPSVIDLTPIVQAVLVVLSALITHRLIPWIKARTTAQQQSNLLAAVNTFVYGAEQFFGAGNGQQKLDYVQQALKSAGYNVDAQEVMATVEAMVKLMQDDSKPEKEA